MCEYCKGGRVVLLIDEVIDYKSAFSPDAKFSDMSFYNISVVIEQRNNELWLRLGDYDDMNCLDHGTRKKLKFCPMCGRNMSE